MPHLKISPLGEAALLLESAPPATLAVQRRVWSVATQARRWPHVIDVVPGMNNLLLAFDPLQAAPDELEARLRAAWHEPPDTSVAGQSIEIPVDYGGAVGIDLPDVARHTGLSPEAIVACHTAAEYIVYFLGFQPGFAYLGGMDPSLATPRRREPRLSVPAGAVGIGGEQTAIYPAASPGGWQLIGHTDVVLFDPERDPPTLLAPGDRVRFIAKSVAL